MRPGNRMRASTQSGFGRDEARTAQALESLWCEPRDDNVALLRRDPRAVAVLHEMSRRPAAVGEQRGILPDPIAAGEVQAAHLAIAVDPVGITIADERR